MFQTRREKSEPAATVTVTALTLSSLRRWGGAAAVLTFITTGAIMADLHLTGSCVSSGTRLHSSSARRSVTRIS